MKDLFRRCATLCLSASAFLLIACGLRKGKEEEKALLQARGFAENYFLFQFDEAYSYCTPESKTWIAWKASNINADDLKSFNRAGVLPEIEIGAFRQEAMNDSCASVYCTVYNELASDSLERSGTVISKRVYLLPLVKRNGEWLVKMAGPLRSGM